jgi:S-adenosylmethionine:tRNA ribosyltransferase-isomerase
MINTEHLLETYVFDFPKELIANQPANERTASRLLNFAGQKIEHCIFSQFNTLIPPESLIVFNNTKVRKARLYGHKKTGARIECFLYEKTAENTFKALSRPYKRLKNGDILDFPDQQSGVVLEKLDDGIILIQFPENPDIEGYIEKHGEMPLPPYIRDFHGDTGRYQTIYACNTGASAAPTAGLHFDTEMITRLQTAGHELLNVTLHVGPGTFKPIETTDVRDYKIHSEYMEIDTETIQKLQKAKMEKRPIIAIGTTSLRAIESAWRHNRWTGAYQDFTRLYLYPGQKVESCDYLLTNFHLPASSLLVLIATLIGVKNYRIIYPEAIREKYRFFSFGDCMLLPNLSR